MRKINAEAKIWHIKPNTTLFDAAGGDRYIQFQFLFVGIFFVYQLFAFRAVMKKVCPQIERKNDDFDDSDF